MKFPVWAVVPAAGFAAAAAIVGGLFWQSSQRPLAPDAAPVPVATADVPADKAVAPAIVASPPPASIALASPPATPAPVVLDKPAIMPPAAAAPPVAPSFDVVRVEPTGETVVAGRGLAGAKIALVEGGGDGKVLVDGIVDGNGQFVLLPPALAQGDHVLVLRMGAPDGSRIESPQNVAVSVADKAKGGVLVALAEPGKATVILSDQGKGDTPVAASAPDAKSAALPPTAVVIPPAVTAPEISIRSAEVETGGGFYATGQAAPGADLRLYLNNSFVAAVKTGENGSWSLKIAKGMQPGHYAVRADLVAPGDGSVVARAEVPFDFPAPALADVVVTPAAPAPVASPLAPAPVAVATAAAPAVAAPADVVIHEIKTATVVRGDSLWRISRKILGKGIRYTQIYEANTQQIRDPRLIHIGQILVIPDAAKP